VDGRSCLHVAAAGNHAKIIEMMMERSKLNEEEAKKAEEEKKAAEKNTAGSGGEEEDGSKEDDEGQDEDEDEDWDEVDSNGSDAKSKKGKDGELDIMADAVDLGAIPEDESSLPDVLNINAPDWDVVATPVGYAVMSGSVDAVKTLIRFGADIKTARKGNSIKDRTSLPLDLTRFVDDSAAACDIAKILLDAGASSTAISKQDELLTVFHEHLRLGKVELVWTYLKHDPNAKKALEFPFKSNFHEVMSPLVSAIETGRYDLVFLLLAWGAKLEELKVEEVLRRGKLHAS